MRDACGHSSGGLSAVSKLAAGFALLLVMPVTGNAATVDLVTAILDGNDCSGYFGTGFESCEIFQAADGTSVQMSPVIAKLDAEDPDDNEFNTDEFPTISEDASEFAGTDLSGSSGTWSYTPGAGDPAIRFWAAKGGPDFKLFWGVDSSETTATCNDTNTGSVNFNVACLEKAVTQDQLAAGQFTWSTPNGESISHLTFYDSENPSPVPIPAAVWLFGTALLSLFGVGSYRRRRILVRKPNV